MCGVFLINEGMIEIEIGERQKDGAPKRDRGRFRNIYIYIYTERERVMRQSCLSPVDDGGFRRVEDGTGNSKRHAA